MNLAARDQHSFSGAIAMRVLLLLAVIGLVSLVVIPFVFSSLAQLDDIFGRAARESRQVALDHLIRLGKLTAQNTAINVRSSVLDNNYSYLQGAVDGIAHSDRNVRFAACLDPKLQVLAWGGPEARQGAPLSRITGLLDSQPLVHYWDEANRTLAVGARVDAGSGTIGSVVVAYDTTDLESILTATAAEKARQNTSALRRTAWTGASVLVLGVLTAIGLGWWISRPVTRLASAASILATGDFEVRAEVAGPAELQQLGRSFNEMASRLKHSLEESMAKAAVDRELALARDLQVSMMPPETRVNCQGFELCSWYSPAGACGGDWFAYYPLHQEGKLLVLIADVMGHGLPAAFVTAAAKSACEAVIEGTEVEPTALLSAIHSATVRAAKGKMTMSTLVAAIDVRAYTVTFAAGGHPWPFVVRPNGRDGYEATIVPVSGTLLGDKTLDLDRSHLTLEPGTVIVWFTDGLLEATSPTDQEYGAKRLKKLLERSGALPLEAILEEIKQDLAKHTQGTPPSDDIAVIVGRYPGASPDA
jgi:sigma-B regulation protein RsbU (phosphoserine phosphatase)